MNVVRATVTLLIRNDGAVCLARKKKAIHKEGGEISYSLGMWNGYGGKEERDDRNIMDTALRELLQESEVIAERDDLKKCAVVFFYDGRNGDKLFMEVHFFTTERWKGSPRETNEMGSPSFFLKDEIPYEEMMEADREIFARILRGETYTAKVTFYGKGEASRFELISKG